MRSNFLSIKWRLALQFTLVVGLMLMIAGSAVFFLFVSKMQQDIDTLLYVQNAAVRTSLPITIDDIGAPDWREQMFKKIEAVKSLGFVVIITDGSGSVMDHSSPFLAPLPKQIGFSSVDAGPNDYRLYKDIYGPYVITIGRTLDSLIAAQNALVSVLLLTLLCTLGLTAGLSAMFAGRALKPLTRFSRRVRDIDPRHLPVPALAGKMPNDEIGQLARTFDDFLRRLEQAFKRERQFTQDASHELRTPLMVIKSSLELLAVNRSLTDPQKEKLALMQGAVKRMETLVTELLELSRGMQSGTRENIPLGDYIREIETGYRAMAEEKGLSLTVTIAKHVATISAHRIALEKVIGNLLKNAIRFSDAGGISVDVTGNVITISDTGIGIAEKDIPHIFERFYRGDTSRRTEGTGLGLAICKDICDEEGWTIRVQSEVGKGTTFRVGF